MLILKALLKFPINDRDAWHVSSLHHSQLLRNERDRLTVNISPTHVDFARLKKSGGEG